MWRRIGSGLDRRHVPLPFCRLVSDLHACMHARRAFLLYINAIVDLVIIASCIYACCLFQDFLHHSRVAEYILEKGIDKRVFIIYPYLQYIKYTIAVDAACICSSSPLLILSRASFIVYFIFLTHACAGGALFFQCFGGRELK